MTGIFSLPVAHGKSICLFEVAQLMEDDFPGLKMMAAKGMSDEEITFLASKCLQVHYTASLSFHVKP